MGREKRKGREERKRAGKGRGGREGSGTCVMALGGMDAPEEVTALLCVVCSSADSRVHGLPVSGGQAML